MKRTIQTLLFVLLLFPITVFAQSSVGFKLGMLSTPYLNYGNDKYSSFNIDYSNSISAALLYNEKVSKVLSLGVTIYYDYYNVDYYKSWYNPVGGGGKESLDMKFGYIGLSFFPQLNFGKKFSLFINAGPYFGFLTKSTAKGSHQSRNSTYDSLISYEIDEKANEYLLSRTIAIMSNMGFRYEIDENWRVIIDASFRYSPSLIYKGGLKSQIDLIFSVGFLYQFEKKRTKSEEN